MQSIVVVVSLFSIITGYMANPLIMANGIRELTDGEKQDLRNFCRDSEPFHTLTLKPSPYFFNQNMAQCLESVSSDTYVGVQLQEHIQKFSRAHARMLYVCSGTDGIHWTKMTTTKHTGFESEYKCKSPYAILKMEANDVQDLNIEEVRTSFSYIRQPVHLILHDTMVSQGNSTCLSFQFKTPTSKDEMNHDLYKWNVCREVNDTLNIMPQSHPTCNVTVFERHSLQVIGWTFSVFLGIYELTSYNTEVLKWEKEEYLLEPASACIYEEQKSVVFILGGIVGFVIIVAAIIVWSIRRKKFRKNTNSNNSSPEEEPFDQQTSATFKVQYEASNEFASVTESRCFATRVAKSWQRPSRLSESYTGHTLTI